MKRALFPGSFDPFTLGHEEVLKLAEKDFDEIIIAVSINPNKTPFLSLEKRKKIIEVIIKNQPKFSVQINTGLTYEFALKNNCNYIIKGYRNNTDLENEKRQAEYNKKMAPSIKTVLYKTEDNISLISSTKVRNNLRNNEDISHLVNNKIIDEIKKGL